MIREVGQRRALALRPRRQQHGGHAGRLAHAQGRDVGLHELHRIVDRQARGDHPARTMDVEIDVAIRIFAFEEDHLGDDQVRDHVVDRGPDEDDAVLSSRE